jgi:short-subunit dehydrogenase
MSRTEVPDWSRFGRVVITGGSSGIGRAFLDALAKEAPAARFLNLSRSAPGPIPLVEDRLTHTAVNLADPEGRKGAVKASAEFLGEDRSPALLINNAGFGAYGPFPEADAARLEAMSSVNMISVLGLTAAALNESQDRFLGIVNIASVAGFQPIPMMSVYAATKAFVLHWSVALAEEHRNDPNVRVLCVCPGPTQTKFFESAGFERDENDAGPAIPFSQSPTDVVAESLRAFRKGRPVVVTGGSNRLSTKLAGLVPRTWSARVAGKVMQRLRLEEFQKKG